jgi:GDP-L-fucose synthase
MIREENSFWAGKRVTVTGGAGFLGYFLIAQLKKRGATDISVPRSKDYNLVEINDVRKMYADFKPDIVIHLASIVGGIGANMKYPGEFFYKNAMMGIQMIEEARINNVKKFVAIGTICAYPKFTPVPFKEENLWCGYPEETNAPYGLAKKMMLVQLQAYKQQYNFNGIYLLPVNLYGPRDNFDLHTSHVIPAIIRKVIEAKRSGKKFIEVWGTGKASREFLYVEDAAEAIILAAEKYEKSEPVNIGSGIEITIKELVSKICSIVGYDGEVRWDLSKPDGQPRRCLDVSKARDRFGFKSKTKFDEGLKRTIDWYLLSLKGN